VDDIVYLFLPFYTEVEPSIAVARSERWPVKRPCARSEAQFRRLIGWYASLIIT